MFFIVYILYSESSDKHYVGCTNDIKRRFSEHNRVKGIYTDKGIPWTLVYSERYPSRGLAESREAEIKSKKSRIFIERLIALAPLIKHSIPIYRERSRVRAPS